MCWTVPNAGLPSVTEFQYFVTEITLLLLKFLLNFGQNTEICLNFTVFPHKNTEIGVKFCKNTEMSAICYWSEFPAVGSPANGSSNWQYIVGSGNALAPNRWQAITWTNSDQNCVAMYGVKRPQLVTSEHVDQRRHSSHEGLTDNYIITIKSLI